MRAGNHRYPSRMKRWFWILDAIAVFSFALIGSDFHGFTFDLLGILRVAMPFLIALGGGVLVLRAWRNPLSIVTGLALAVISLVVGMLMRHYLWNEGTARAFILVTGGYFIATMVGWRLFVHAGLWFTNRSGSANAST